MSGEDESSKGEEGRTAGSLSSCRQRAQELSSSIADLTLAGLGVGKGGGGVESALRFDLENLRENFLRSVMALAAVGGVSVVSGRWMKTRASSRRRMNVVAGSKNVAGILPSVVASRPQQVAIRITA